MTAVQRDPLTVDEDGFVLGTRASTGAFGSRPSVGGLGARVATADGRCAVIVGMGTAEGGGLLLSVVWLAVGRASGGPTSTETEAAIDAYDRSEVQAHAIPAAGLVALDAWLGDLPAAAGDPWAQHGPDWCPNDAH